MPAVVDDPRALADVASGFSAFRPPKRVPVSQAAAQHLVISQPGGFNGSFSLDEAPYMIEPMDTLASRRHEAVTFVGPSRSSKTMSLVDGWIAHNVCCDPGDMLVVQMSQEKAREYSKTRVDRSIRSSPDIRAMTTSRVQDDNTHDKMFRNGMFLRIGWPTVTQLSGSDYRYVAVTDYDRIHDDIDGEGSCFMLALKRTQTFMSRGMCMIESSPGRNLKDPDWRAVTAHEAPPCGGILEIYNTSDRRRWYWPCPSCGEYFQAEPGIGMFGLPPELELLDIVRTEDLGKLSAKYSRLICPYCEAGISHSHKQKMNRAGRWVGDGQIILANGQLEGDAIHSNNAGFWLGGIAAAYQSWASLVQRYLQGLRSYALSGEEFMLQTTVNTDQAMPYMPRILAHSKADASTPESREDTTLQRFLVPSWARFLVAAVDNQGGQNARFVVQVHAIGPNLEQVPIDRYEIKVSKRPGIGEDEFAPIDPAGYDEDWDQITDLVLQSTYRLAGDEGREMRVRMVAIDTGGEDGVTLNAYAWYRRIRKAGFASRVLLVKGASTKNAPVTRESKVGGVKKGEEGDIPLLSINPNIFKDTLANMLKRTEPGAGYFHVPKWLPTSFWDEMRAEVRQPNGTWRKVRKRNEALDLCNYIRAACLYLKADRMDWTKPPEWAETLDKNPYVITAEQRRRMQEGTQPARMRRRSTRSKYMS